MTAAGGVSYGYDFNGNQTSRASDTFVWDHENRLTSATIGGTQTTYAYSGDGLRMSRTAGGTTNYTWDVAAGLPMLLQDGTYTYVYGLGMIYWVDGSGNVTYRLTDGLGSTVALCNGSGTVTDSWTYDVFGAIRSHSGSNATEFTFTSEQNDPNGLEYLRARYYDSATGRFISRDPIWQLNGYAYANNNPVNASDPSGKWCQGGQMALASDRPGGTVGGGCGIMMAGLGAIALCNAACRQAVAAFGQRVVNGVRWFAGLFGGGGESAVTPPDPIDPFRNRMPEDPNRWHHIFDEPEHHFDLLGVSQQEAAGTLESIANNPNFYVGTVETAQGPVAVFRGIAHGQWIEVRVFTNSGDISDAWVLLP